MKNAEQCEKIRENVLLVNLNRVEESADEFDADLIFDLALGVKPRTAVASRPRSSSDDSVSTDDTVVRGKLAC